MDTPLFPLFFLTLILLATSRPDFAACAHSTQSGKQMLIELHDQQGMMTRSKLSVFKNLHLVNTKENDD